VPSYLEIALRAATPAGTQQKQQPVRSEPKQVLRANKPIAEAQESSVSAACGSPHCAGCYEVAPGVLIHPPKCSEDYLAWLERWEAKGLPQ
jgi:hypothetical protein